MNYSNHNLRTNLQEWKNRVYRATYQQFGNQLKFLFNNIGNNKQLSALMGDACNSFSLTPEELDQILNEHRIDIEYSSETHQAAFCYQLLKYFFEKYSYDMHRYTPFQRGDFDDTKTAIVEEYIAPIIYYLHDKLDKSNATIFLLEKYKRRTEWFTKKSLSEKYSNATKSYEQIFEDDLRLFLFDQGIDYPFSTPSSASGRADIIGEIETSDPLIIEVKIFDSEKGYRKDRIKEGFSQIVKYANDYNKDVAFLVLYNMDNAELNFNLGPDNKVFPPMLNFNNKNFYFVTINCFSETSASKTGTLKQIEITAEELTQK